MDSRSVYRPSSGLVRSALIRALPLLLLLGGCDLSGIAPSGPSSQASATPPDVAVGGATPTSGPAAPSAFRFGAYFVEWGIYARDYLPADVPAGLLTQLNYAFIKPQNAGQGGLYECAFADPAAAVQRKLSRLLPGTDTGKGDDLGNLGQLRVLQRDYPALQLIMSVGGASQSGDFPAIASTPTGRDHFAKACVGFMQQHNFDGIDIDWEFPKDADRDNFTALLKSIRQELDRLGAATGRTYSLSISAPVVEKDVKAIDIPAVAPLLSWVNLMAYEYNGGWDSSTGHNAPLCPAPGDPHGPAWNAAASVELWVKGGLPAGKLNLGLPYYGHAFRHLQDAGPDPLAPGRFAPTTPGDYLPGTWDAADGSAPTSTFDYWDIAQRFGGPFKDATSPQPGLDGYTRYWDASQSVPFLFRPDAVGAGGDGLWLSYDDPQSLADKVQYARSAGLGGVFAWELSEESPPGTGEHPLSAAIAAAIAAPQTPYNCGGR